MNRRRFLLDTIVVGATLAVVGAAAQQQKRLPRIALLTTFPAGQGSGPDPLDPDVRAFIRSLRDLGLVDGSNIIVERISLEGRIGRAPALMQDVVRRPADVIVTAGGPAVWAAHRATNRIPIVGIVDDVLDMGIIDSLARPGHNLTGIGESDPALHSKRLQLLQEAAPSITRVAVICYKQGPNDRGMWRQQLDAGAAAINLGSFWVAVDAPEEFEQAFASIVRGRANALYVTTTHVNFEHATLIADFARKHGMAAYGFPEAGMLLDYSSDYKEIFRRAAFLVKQILDGAKPGDLPFEQPTKFELTINPKTAKALGLTIPRQMLLRATEVIQ